MQPPKLVHLPGSQKLPPGKLIRHLLPLPLIGLGLQQDIYVFAPLIDLCCPLLSSWTPVNSKIFFIVYYV